MILSAYESFCRVVDWREPEIKQEWDELEQLIDVASVNDKCQILVDSIKDFNKVRLEVLGYVVQTESDKIKISWDLTKEVQEQIMDVVLDKRIVPVFIKVL